jgi:hypothetical protein
MKAEGQARLPLVCFILLPSAFCLLLGCAHYEYDIVEPPEFAGHVPEKKWTSVRRDELEYRLRSYDNRLIMRIHNRGERAVKLLGPDSAAIDPRGESHPLHSATILPGSYVQRIFPPPRPSMQRFGPSFGIGVGGAFSSGYGRYGYGHRYYDPFYPSAFDHVEPRYYTLYDPNDRTYFQWSGEKSVRLLLTCQREGGETFRHEWVLRKRKM